MICRQFIHPQVPAKDENVRICEGPDLDDRQGSGVDV